jgi:adenylate cyclase class 2
MLATLVTVPEIDGTFLEVETITDDDLTAALDAVRAVLTDLGIEDHDLTSEQYTDAVIASRT